MIFIADYGAGNLRSVHKAFEFLGIDAVVSDKAAEMGRYDKVLIPGVGAFGPAMETFNRLGFGDAIGEHIDKGRSVLGICLGMQLFLTESEEMGTNQGLDLVPGKVLHFPRGGDKIPQIGWNTVKYSGSQPVLFRSIPDESWFYFVHSYYCRPDDPKNIAATTEYAGKKFCSAIEKNGIFAVQFHPEKSSEAGLQVLKNFAEF
ncbi:MAG TPA: imidazole glycerol phosphate synthase subunit HisH [Chlorobaculum parvum]|uniref:Imidazole glycerol phosphate synthase subunit HisH n=1 Tax=Chlorobaculum parvum TaxID=274539 RepID=A0A7C5H9J1_9CHLB|nr:imidazole glycerol phosphate synthase subunit HisH [Chlorobaculum parvum]